MNRRNFLKISMVTPMILSSFNAISQTVSKELTVINAGIGGNTTVDILARIENSCLKHSPDLTILMAGTNDMNSKKHIPLPEYEKNMRSIINKIINNGSKIIIMPLLPAYEPYLYTRHEKTFYEPEGFAVKMSEVNNLIQNLALEYKLTFLDMHHIFKTTGNIGEAPNSWIQNEANSGKTDGLHPTQEGYRVMAVAIYDCIIQNKLPHTKVVCLGDSITAGTYPKYLEKLLSY